MAHITGGGLVENVPRVLPDHVAAVLDRRLWPMPPLFHWLQREGNVADAEMHRVFNCGIGMVVVVAAEHQQRAIELLTAAGEAVYSIGHIEARLSGAAQTTVL
jgi:phosphoribosylformylglycinamidine cyclo-ligase